MTDLPEIDLGFEAKRNIETANPNPYAKETA